MNGSKTVDEYIIKNEKWREALNLLRDICLSAGMEETIKWGAPVYTVSGKNVVGLGAFKAHVAVWFFQGALLKDKNNVLINAQEGKTNALRHLRFKSASGIDQTLLSNYINEAIANQKEGKEIKIERNKVLIIPDELALELKNNKEFEAAYFKFSLSKQREFADYVSAAKRPETKMKRLDKIIPMIIKGTGLNDRYRK